MDPFQRRSSSERVVLGQSDSKEPVGQGKARSRTRTPKSYRFCDGVTGCIIGFMIVFTPWAFGTTQTWSIWTMNISGFALGALLLAKWIVRRQTGYSPARWDGTPEVHDSELISSPRKGPERLIQALAVLTGLVLVYTLISALNARADYIEWQRRFDYRDCIRWLPHSYDRAATFHAFWKYLGLACFFWATREWLLARSSRERRRRSGNSQGASAHPFDFSSPRWPGSSTSPESELVRVELPARLKLLLWILCLNGALLALEAILQRLSGTNRLLWLVEPRISNDPLWQFGPYAYRANAAAYFNLVWPTCLAFWLVLRQSAMPSLRFGRRLGSGQHLVLLPGAVLMAACPIISSSRGGALVAVAMILLLMTLLLRLMHRESLGLKVGICSLFALILGFSAFLGIKQLAPRFKTIFTDQMSQRTEIYQNALPMARDFPVFGTGPGAFGALYQLYRKSPIQGWAGYVHDDWLETRIAFGWIGFSIILLMLALVLAHWFHGRGIGVRWEFTAMLWVALGGCLLHAKFDFPLQIYSILFLVVLLCAILSCLARHRSEL